MPRIWPSSRCLPSLHSTSLPSCPTIGHLNGCSVPAVIAASVSSASLLHVVGHVGVGRHHHHLRLQAAPGVFRGPLALELCLDALDVVGRPVVHDRGQLGLRAELDHLGVLAEGELAAFGGDLHRRRAVGVLHDDVGALVDQRLGCVGFLAGVEPVVYPDDLDLDVRVDGLRRQHGGVDAGDDLRDRERADIAEHAGLGHFCGDQALDVTALVEPAGICRHVLVALVARSVLEMHVGIFFGDFQRRLHIAERGGEDQLVTGARQLLDRTLGVRAFADVFEVGSLNLVAKFLDHGLAAEVVLIGPTEVADRAEIDEADLELVGRGGAKQACRRWRASLRSPR